MERIASWLMAGIVCLLAVGIYLEPPMTEERSRPLFEMYAHRYACAQWHQDEQGVYNAAVRYNNLIARVYPGEGLLKLPPRLQLDPYLAEAVKASGDCGYNGKSSRW